MARLELGGLFADTDRTEVRCPSSEARTIIGTSAVLEYGATPLNRQQLVTADDLPAILFRSRPPVFREPSRWRSE